MRIDPLHIEIPKDAIDKIVERYKCSPEDAVRAYLTARKDSEDAYQNTIDSIFGEPETTTVKKPGVYTPSEIKNHLDKYVVGQEDYKKRLSIASAYHFALVQKLITDPNRASKVKRFRKKNTLISGPSGSGKTYCVEILGDLLEVPTLIIDATDYTEAGYVGKNADDMIRELIQMAPGSGKHEKAEFVEKNGGLIFIDEIDKKAKDGKVIGHDISREGFQRAVLKLIERKHISVEDPMSPAGQIQELLNQQRGRDAGKSRGVISTENILFVLGGSFQRTGDDLESIVRNRLERGADRAREDGSFTIRGFTSPAANPDRKHLNYYREADSDDYIRFGLIPELVGRAPVRTYVNALSKNDLIRIMTKTEDSIIDQYKLEFSLFGIDITFSDDALMWIAEQAENHKTGARALISVFENVLTDFQFELPGTNFRKLTLTREMCQSPRDSVLKMLTRSPFMDFIQKFRKDHGIELNFTEQAERKIEKHAQDNGLSISSALAKLMQGASALNYMNWQGPFTVTEEAVDNPKYFDELYVKWHKEQLEARESRGADSSALP